MTAQLNPTFDADTGTAGAPELTLGGIVYRGRVVSIAEWFDFKDRFAAQDEKERAEGDKPTKETLAESTALMLEFLRVTFPPQDGVDPIAEIERRGFLAIRTVFSSFFGHLLYALGLVPALQQMMATDGTNSQSSTTSASSENASDSATS